MLPLVRRISPLLVAILFLPVAACASFASPILSCPEGWDRASEYRLYFGRSDSRGAEVVSDEHWAEFLADTVTPRFPDGLTVTNGAGQWQTADGKVSKERTKILTILVWPEDAAQERIDEISAEYERRFSQESVLRVAGETCGSFS